MSKAETVIKAIDLINDTIPGIATIIVTLKNGKEINLQDLVRSTRDIVEQKLKEAQDHLAKES